MNLGILVGGEYLDLPDTFVVHDVELAGTILPVHVFARVDRDGEARTRASGDVEGAVDAQVPAKGLQLKLNHRVEE